MLTNAAATNLRTSSSAYAEMFSGYSNEERRRRGIYQAEWAGKLPWELPGLDEGLAFIEVEMRSSHSSLNSVRQDEPHVTMEDLELLERVLLDMQDSLSPEDMPGNNLPHPVQETTILIKKLKKNIEALTLSFDRLNRSRWRHPYPSGGRTDSSLFIRRTGGTGSEPRNLSQRVD